MNTENPLVPQGSLLEQQSKKKSNLLIAVIAIVTFHMALFMGMLIQGCKKEDTSKKTMGSQEQTNFLAGLNTNDFYSSTPTYDSNQPVVTPGATAGLTSAAPSSATPGLGSPLGTSTTPTTPGLVPESPLGAKEYKVVKGDSFFKIAKDHGVSQQALVAANPGFEPKKLKPGQTLLIPAPTPAAPKATTPTTDAGTVKSVETSAYKVKSGDTLAKIARNHGTTIKAIKAANGLKTDHLKVGQSLKIPASKVTAKSEATPATTPATSPGGVTRGAGQM